MTTIPASCAGRDLDTDAVILTDRRGEWAEPVAVVLVSVYVEAQLMPALIQDVRYALRLLVKDRSFSITALLTLAVCIAANTATFSVVRSVLLKPLPIDESEQLVLLYNSYPNAGAPRVGAAVPDVRRHRGCDPPDVAAGDAVVLSVDADDAGHRADLHRRRGRTRPERRGDSRPWLLAAAVWR
jgi:hypothetical protein